MHMRARVCYLLPLLHQPKLCLVSESSVCGWMGAGVGDKRRGQGVERMAHGLWADKDENKALRLRGCLAAMASVLQQRGECITVALLMCFSRKSPLLFPDSGSSSSPASSLSCSHDPLCLAGSSMPQVDHLIFYYTYYHGHLQFPMFIYILLVQSLVMHHRSRHCCDIVKNEPTTRLPASDPFGLTPCANSPQRRLLRTIDHFFLFLTKNFPHQG